LIVGGWPGEGIVKHLGCREKKKRKTSQDGFGSKYETRCPYLRGENRKSTGKRGGKTGKRLGRKRARDHL